MSMTLNERNPNIAIIPIGTVASTAAAVLPGLYFRKHSRIKSVWFSDQVGVTKDNTNYLTVKLQDLTNTPVVYAKAATSDAAAVANTPLALTLQSPDDADTNHLEKDVPAGTTLNARVEPSGSGHATAAVMIVEWYPL